MERKKTKLPKISGHYVIKDEDALLINRILARIDRALDIYEKISNIEAQRFEMDIRESIERTVNRGEQQNILKKALSYLDFMRQKQIKDEMDSKKSLKELEQFFKPNLKTKGKKISAKDKRL